MQRSGRILSKPSVVEKIPPPSVGMFFLVAFCDVGPKKHTHTHAQATGKFAGAPALHGYLVSTRDMPISAIPPLPRAVSLSYRDFVKDGKMHVSRVTTTNALPT